MCYAHHCHNDDDDDEGAAASSPIAESKATINSEQQFLLAFSEKAGLHF